MKNKSKTKRKTLKNIDTTNQVAPQYADATKFMDTQYGPPIYIEKFNYNNYSDKVSYDARSSFSILQDGYNNTFKYTETDNSYNDTTTQSKQSRKGLLGIIFRCIEIVAQYKKIFGTICVFSGVLSACTQHKFTACLIYLLQYIIMGIKDCEYNKNP